jgi:succinylglutamic semialdehyde dehydrogenase
MNYIDGVWAEGSGDAFSSVNPATGEIMWQGKAASANDVHTAVAAARRAHAGWKAQGYEARLEICKRFHALVSERKEALAVLISQETGKALWDTRGEAAAVLGKLANAEAAYRERTGIKSTDMKVGHAVLRHQPHGVLAIFAPYNFPAHLANGHIIPALLAGNTLVLKPSELTPVVPEWMVGVWEEAGLPKGVLNLVQGEKETGVALSSAAIDGVLFTGSTATGKAIHKQFGGRPEVLVALEMGGNNPLIVHEVEDIDAAVLETILSAFTGTGQRCTCARRLIVTGWEKQDVFIEKLVSATQQLRIGAYDESPAPFMGPLVTNREVERVLEGQIALEQAGGKVLLRARRLRDELPFVSPAIIDSTNVEKRDDEEIFGPLLQVIRVNGMEEAVTEANNTQYGLSAAIFADDRAIFEQYAPHMHAGLVNFNRQTTGASGAAPFGGVGCSGNHRPAGYYAADYCAYPVASVEMPSLALPDTLPDGVSL